MARNCRHGDLHEHADEQQHRRDGQRDDPAEAGPGACDHDDAAEADDRRVEHDAHDQHAHRLDLRDSSFVVRVMSEAVENLSISTDENDSTLRNTCARRSRPMAADIFEPT